MMDNNIIDQRIKLQQLNVYTIDDIALLTGLAKSTIYRLSSEGVIVGHSPFGKQKYFKRQEVERIFFGE